MWGVCFVFISSDKFSRFLMYFCTIGVIINVCVFVVCLFVSLLICRDEFLCVIINVCVFVVC